MHLVTYGADLSVLKGSLSSQDKSAHIFIIGHVA
jgi:hypothetical protein